MLTHYSLSIWLFTHYWVLTHYWFTHYWFSFSGDTHTSLSCIAPGEPCYVVNTLLQEAFRRRSQQLEPVAFSHNSVMWRQLAQLHRDGHAVLEFIAGAGCVAAAQGHCRCHPHNASHIRALVTLNRVVEVHRRNNVRGSKAQIIVWLDPDWLNNEVWNGAPVLSRGVGVVPGPDSTTSTTNWDWWVSLLCGAVGQSCPGGAIVLGADGDEVADVAGLRSVSRVIICPLPPRKLPVAEISLATGPNRHQLVFIAGIEGASHHGLIQILANLAACELRHAASCGPGCSHYLYTRHSLLRQALTPLLSREAFAAAISSLEGNLGGPGRLILLEDISFPAGTSTIPSPSPWNCNAGYYRLCSQGTRGGGED